MTVDEVQDNIHHFAVARVSPRVPACTALILSGADGLATDDLDTVIAAARQFGVTHITLHQSADGLRRGTAADALAVTVRTSADLRAISERPGSEHLAAVVPLESPVLADIDALAAGLVDAAPHRVVATWTFPPGPEPAPPADVVTALEVLGTVLDANGVPWAVKGLPACLLGSHAPRIARSRNRWYVDASHQRDDALLFFPDVVRFAKADDCRYCTLEASCDGVAREWLGSGRAGPLRPLS